MQEFKECEEQSERKDQEIRELKDKIEISNFKNDELFKMCKDLREKLAKKEAKKKQDEE